MKFSKIVADCPWDYNDKKNNDPAMGGLTYKSMVNEDLYNLNLSDVAENDSLLFSWSTMPKLKEGIEFIERNGFKYITCGLVWVKINPKGEVTKEGKDITLKGGIYSGLGHYFNGNAELLLIGKRGKGLKRIRKDIKQIMIEPRGIHSKKPEEAQNRIEQLYGTEGNMLEVFARRQRSNWVCVGNEISGNSIEVDLELIKQDKYS